MYCYADIPSHSASNTILSSTSVQSFILTTTDDHREVHWTVIGDFCPSHSWCWITFCQTEQTHHVTFVYGLPTRNVCNRWCIFKRNKSLTGIKKCKDLNFISNSYETLSDFGCVNVEVRQLRSKVRRNDNKCIRPQQTYTAHKLLPSLLHYHTHYWLHICIHHLHSWLCSQAPTYIRFEADHSVSSKTPVMEAFQIRYT